MALSLTPESDSPTWNPATMTPRQMWFDTVLGLAAAGLAALLVAVVLPPVWLRPETMLTARVLSFVGVVPLVARRRYPALCVAVIAAVDLVQVIVGFPWLLPANLAMLVALYSVTVYGSVLAGRLALAAAILGAGILAAGIGRYQEHPDAMPLVIIGAMVACLLLATWALALVRRSHRQTVWALRSRAGAMQARAEALDDRAVMMELRARKAEVERDREAQLAANAERIRIAREMHDIIGHALTGMVFLANSAEYAATATGDAAAAAGALRTISKTGTDALATMRQLLNVLRDEAGQWREAETGAPTPGTIGVLHDAADPYGWHRLITENQALGMNLSVSETGTPVPLEPAVANALYRITQEALTNVRKHAAPEASVNVEFEWLGTGLRLSIANDAGDAAPAVASTSQLTADQLRSGQSRPGQLESDQTRPGQLKLGQPGPGGHTGLSTHNGSGGQGLIGMRERANLAGGQLTAGPTPTGWQVTFTFGS